MKVEFDHHSVLVDGQRKLIRSGSLHYFRLPAPELWRDRLAKMRAAGLNAVDLYYPWNYHSEVRGDFDFSGPRDVDLLHDMIEDEGLYLIARPGPYICAEIDFGGLPAWMLREPSIVPRCRNELGYSHSVEFVKATREWFEQIVPRFAHRSNLLLAQIENEYSVPSVFAGIPQDLYDLLIRWFGSKRLERIANHPAVRRRIMGRKGGVDEVRGQTSSYMRELRAMMLDLGVDVPIFHNDVSPRSGRQADVDILSLDRYPIVDFSSDWRDRKDTFDEFLSDEEDLAAHREQNPVFYPELQGGWYDGWGGTGYDFFRERLGPEGICNATVAALAARATLWNYYVFCGGITWGYMSSPDVYSSYDYAAPITESGGTGVRYETVHRLNEFLERFEQDIARTDVLPGRGRGDDAHLITRQGFENRYVFLRNPNQTTCKARLPESERAELAPWETQIRVYDAEEKLLAVSPEPLRWKAPTPQLPPALPRLERWSFSCASPQIDPAYDDASWDEIPAEAVKTGTMDIDSLGLHYGFVWYRGVFEGPLDRLRLDARHCWAVWINGALIASGDQHRNALGVGPDGARISRIGLGAASFSQGHNTIVICVESLGHNKGFADDGANPRGIVRIDTGHNQIRWRFRGGLVRGERGLTPIVAFDGVERVGTREVILPHGWPGNPEGVGLYETSFELEGIDAKSMALGLAFDPGRGKANLYLNSYLIGRYWPELGPQRRFLLPWGVLRPEGENHLAVALWKRNERAALGKLRLEPM
ncbi:MAG: hypothetical protein GY725_01450 [bacterium]|nr:hypothetical protein [bacterium]